MDVSINRPNEGSLQGLWILLYFFLGTYYCRSKVHQHIGTIFLTSIIHHIK